MNIEEQDQWGTDFDWFCVDDAGEIGHFTTAGFKLLPKSVSSSAEDLKLVTDYFEKEAPVRCAHLIDGDFKGNLRDFLAMADRGLYSFDIETYGTTYSRVARPEVPLRLIDLPKPIREIVGRTIMRERVLKDSSRVAYEETLEI
jgi:hypothetical protein